MDQRERRLQDQKKFRQGGDFKNYRTKRKETTETKGKIFNEYVSTNCRRNGHKYTEITARNCD